MTIRENVALGPLTTLGVGGAARYFAVAENEMDVAEAVRWAEERGLPLFVLGGGSNLLVSDAGFPGLVVQIAIKGVQDCGEGTFEVGAGEVWDEFVGRMVKAGMQGVECLAGIPGSVGGTPVQNVGAYGQEVAETIVSVRALDRKTAQFVELDRKACKFRYRKSLFNSDEPDRYIVTRVAFKLHPNGQPQVTYGDVKRHFVESSEVADCISRCLCGAEDSAWQRDADRGRRSGLPERRIVLQESGRGVREVDRGGGCGVVQRRGRTALAGGRRDDETVGRVANRAGRFWEGIYGWRGGNLVATYAGAD